MTREFLSVIYPIHIPMFILSTQLFVYRMVCKLGKLLFLLDSGNNVFAMTAVFQIALFSNKGLFFDDSSGNLGFY